MRCTATLFFFSVRHADAPDSMERLRMTAQWMTHDSAETCVSGYVQFAHPATLFRLCKFTRGRVYFQPHFVQSMPTQMKNVFGFFLPIKSTQANRCRALIQQSGFMRSRMFELDPMLAMRCESDPLLLSSDVLEIHSYKDLKDVHFMHARVVIHPQAADTLSRHCDMQELSENGLARCISIKYKCHLYNTFALLSASTQVIFV
jgi:hypothetical protein